MSPAVRVAGGEEEGEAARESDAEMLGESVCVVNPVREFMPEVAMGVEVTEEVPLGATERVEMRLSVAWDVLVWDAVGLAPAPVLLPAALGEVGGVRVSCDDPVAAVLSLAREEAVAGAEGVALALGEDEESAVAVLMVLGVGEVLPAACEGVKKGEVLP